MLLHTAQNPDKLVKLAGDTELLQFEDKGVFDIQNKDKGGKMMNS